jgi:endonuclease G, mitochondrial
MSVWDRRFGGVEAAGAAAIAKVSDKLADITSYEGRSGYDPKFLNGPALPLPGLGAWQDDAVPLHDEAIFRDGADPHELAYTHFSVKQSRSRRQPLFSAVNISGDISVRKTERTDLWIKDPRISLEVQILRESYGKVEDGLFSRGHMTRREDPNWGTPDIVKQADADTFHVTNACPQQQKFNAGLWLALESYVLDNVDKDDIRASVLTGPIFQPDDPVYKGVKVPVEFWKIVVYKHPELKTLAAIAYKRSQASFLPALRKSRFVFGDFQDTQVTIASLQEDTGLDFSTYRPLDVMREANPSLSVRLTSVEDAYLTP